MFKYVREVANTVLCIRYPQAVYVNRPTQSFKGVHQ